jgi:hypothetical protein
VNEVKVGFAIGAINAEAHEFAPGLAHNTVLPVDVF